MVHEPDININHVLSIESKEEKVQSSGNYTFEISSTKWQADH